MCDKESKYNIGSDGHSYGYDKKGGWGILTLLTKLSEQVTEDISQVVTSGKKLLISLMIIDSLYILL